MPAAPSLPAARWGICVLLLLVTADNYLNRQVLSVLAPELIRVLGWSPQDYATIVFWFQCGYAVGFLAGGKLFDRFGTRWGFVVAVTAWCLVAAAHGAAESVMGFMVARFSLGLAEAGHMSGGVKAVAEWFPPVERAVATGIFKCGSNIGAIAAPLLVPVFYSGLGWRGTFVVIGALGLVWLVAWEWFHRKWRAPSEATPFVGKAVAVPWRVLLGRRQTWAYVIVKFMTDAVWHWYLFMLPLFLSQRFGLSLAEFGLPAVVVYAVAATGSVGGGWLSARWMRAGWEVTRARKGAMLVCCLATLPVVLVTTLDNLWVVILLVGLAHAAHQGMTSNLFASVPDMFPREAVGSVVGFGGTAGQMGAAVMTLVSGLVLERTGSLVGMFFVTGSAYLAAFAIFHVLVPRLELADFGPRASVPPDERPLR
jgi:ACS family hexuronate transporter-like MFS transporter